MNVARLFDVLQERFKIKNDAAMCRELEVQASVISKMRNGLLPLSPTVILKIHEYLGVPVKEIRELAAT